MVSLGGQCDVVGMVAVLGGRERERRQIYNVHVRGTCNVL